MNEQSEVSKHEVYRITVKGVLDAKWSDWFQGMRVTPQPGNRTALTGSVADQAALHGLLHRIRDMGLPLLSVERVDDEDR
jgi:hypothetical protein